MQTRRRLSCIVEVLESLQRDVVVGNLRIQKIRCKLTLALAIFCTWGMIAMADVILTNVKLCTGAEGTVPREGVSNSGRIVGVSDRVDLRVNAEPLQRRAEAVQLDGPRVDRVNPGDVERRQA